VPYTFFSAPWTEITEIIDNNAIFRFYNFARFVIIREKAKKCKKLFTETNLTEFLEIP